MGNNTEQCYEPCDVILSEELNISSLILLTKIHNFSLVVKKLGLNQID